MADEDEEEVDAPELTADEVKSLKEKAAQLDEVTKTKTEMEAKLKELEADEQNINWKKAREKEKRLLAALKSSGKNVDDEGNMIDEPKGYTEEEFAKKTRDEIERTLIEKELTRAEKKLAESDRPIFRRAYDKVIHGESVSSDNVEEFVEQALQFAGQKKGTSASDRSSGTRGGAPVFEDADKSFANTPEGEEVFQKLWPGLGAKKK